MTRSRSSAVVASPLKCIDVFPPPLLFRGPRDKKGLFLGRQNWLKGHLAEQVLHTNPQRLRRHWPAWRKRWRVVEALPSWRLLWSVSTSSLHLYSSEVLETKGLFLGRQDWLKCHLAEQVLHTNPQRLRRHWPAWRKRWRVVEALPSWRLRWSVSTFSLHLYSSEVLETKGLVPRKTELAQGPFGWASSPHQSATAPETLTRLTETMMRNRSSAVVASPLKCIDVFPPPLLFRGPRDKRACSSEDRMPARRKYRHHKLCCFVPQAVRSVGERRVPFFLRTGSEEWPIANAWSIVFASFIIPFLTPVNVVVHGHEDYVILEIFW